MSDGFLVFLFQLSKKDHSYTR